MSFEAARAPMFHPGHSWASSSRVSRRWRGRSPFPCVFFMKWLVRSIGWAATRRLHLSRTRSARIPWWCSRLMMHWRNANSG